MTATTYFWLAKEVEAEVTFDYSAACKGFRGPFGEPMEPDAEARVDIKKVQVKNQNILSKLSKKEVLNLEDKCFEYLHDRNSECAMPLATADASW